MTEMYITSAGMRIINLLVGQPPQAIAEMIESLNVTRTAITEQLSELIEAGYVERTVEKLSSRGRPRHRYGVTDLALTILFPGNQGVVVPSLWKRLEMTCGLSISEQIQEAIALDLAATYKKSVDGDTLPERLDQFCKELNARKIVSEVRKNEKGATELVWKTNPFISMQDGTDRYNKIATRMVSEILGVSVKLTASRLSGNYCDIYEIE